MLNPSSDFFELPAYAARKADGSLAVLVLNKDNTNSFAAQISLANYLPWTNATVRSYGIAQDEAARTNAIAPGAQDIATNQMAVAGTNFSAAFSPYSATVLTIPPAAPQLAAALLPGGPFVLEVLGQAGVRYVLQNSTNFVAWKSIATNTLAGSVWNVTNSPASPANFWRAVWQPQ